MSLLHYAPRCPHALATLRSAIAPFRGPFRSATPHSHAPRCSFVAVRERIRTSPPAAPYLSATCLWPAAYLMIWPPLRSGPTTKVDRGLLRAGLRPPPRSTAGHVAGGGGGADYRRRWAPATRPCGRPPLVPLQAKMKGGFCPKDTLCGFHLSLKREMNYPTNLRVRRAWEGVKELRHKRFGTDPGQQEST
jgi:hypothetical protein